MYKGFDLKILQKWSWRASILEKFPGEHPLLQAFSKFVWRVSLEKFVAKTLASLNKNWTVHYNVWVSICISVAHSEWVKIAYWTISHWQLFYPQLKDAFPDCALKLDGFPIVWDLAFLLSRDTGKSGSFVSLCWEQVRLVSPSPWHSCHFCSNSPSTVYTMANSWPRVCAVHSTMSE